MVRFHGAALPNVDFQSMLTTVIPAPPNRTSSSWKLWIPGMVER